MNEQGNNTNTNGVIGSTNTVNSTSNNGTVQQPSTPSIEITNVVQQDSGDTFVEYTGVKPQSVNVQPQPVSSVGNGGTVQQPITPSVENTTVAPQQPSAPAVETAVQATTETQNSKDTATKTDINYKPPGAFKTLLLIIFFGGLVAFIIFLPEIQAYIAEYGFVGKGQTEITDGRLICTLDTNTTNLDKSFERTFIFADKKLESATFTTTTKGDITKDEKTLDELSNTCKMKKEYVSSISGIGITCDYSDGLLTEKEHFDYKDFDVEKVKTAYAEAGVDVIEYEYGYDIDKIKTSMLQAGFSCKIER